MKKFVWRFLLFISIIGVLLFIFKTPILKGVGNYLIKEHTFENIEYAFVLSGGAVDRGQFAAELYHNNKINQIICTGENQSFDIEVLNLPYLESDLSKMQLLKSKVPEQAIHLLPKGTSTFEEAQYILSFCQQKGLNECVIVSSKFHTRRIYSTFNSLFASNEIDVFIQGAPSSVYNEREWWKNEYGLLTVNNEYIKLLYYWMKY